MGYGFSSRLMITLFSFDFITTKHTFNRIGFSIRRSEPQCRPSFQELMEKLKDMQRQCAIQLQAGRAAAADAGRKER